MAYTSPSVTQSGSTFAQLVSGGVSGLLERLITANTGPTAAPTAAPTLATGSGGTLNGTFYVTVTETNGFGETTNGGQVSASAAPSTQKITVTFASLKSGNTARNVYIGTSNTGPWMLVARGITASTYDITALPTNSLATAQPPSVNTAGLVNAGQPRKLSLLRGAEKGNLQDVFRFLASEVSAFNSGSPIDLQEFYRKLNDAHAAIAILNQLCVEVGTLTDANPGTVRNSVNGIGGGAKNRTFP